MLVGGSEITLNSLLKVKTESNREMFAVKITGGCSNKNLLYTRMLDENLGKYFI
jgi:hypothetical protein